MSVSKPHSELVATVRAGLGAGDRLVPGTMSEEEHQAMIALDSLEEQLEAQERELVAARIDIASARDMCARPAGVCFPASRQNA